MSDNRIQASFNAGEFAPTLYARVDLAKYRSAAALLENWFVDYRGGASTRPGTRYILQCYKSDKAVRLIAFQASFTEGFILEFGDLYIRFYLNGVPVLEDSISITAATNANPCVVTVPGHNYQVGDWIFITGVVGMTQLNSNYYSISAIAGDDLTLADLNGVPINSAGYGAYVSGGSASRVYTVPTLYQSADLYKIKYAQNINQLVLCHPEYAPTILTYVGPANNWTIAPIQIGTTVQAPTNVVVTGTLSAGSVNYSYVVTAVSPEGEESIASISGDSMGNQDMRTVAGTMTISWDAVSGAASYNVYKATPTYAATIASGIPYGFIGNVTGLSLDDTNISPDFSQTPPIVKNPFQGAGIQSITVTNKGTPYTDVPDVIIDDAPSGGQTATARAVLKIQGTPTPSSSSPFWFPGQVVRMNYYGSEGAVVVIKSVTGGVGPSTVSAYQPMGYPNTNPGAVTSGAAPPLIAASGLVANVVWGVEQVDIISQGSGYTTTPGVTFSAGGATATATLGPVSAGNPSVPGYFQQRLVLAAPKSAPQTFYMSQPGNHTNFNISNPTLPSDAITGTLVSGQLNTIRAMIPQTSGLLMFTDRFSWIINGGSNGSAVGPDSTVANAQSFNGIGDVPPIMVNYDVLYVQAKGSVIRDSAFNIYQNVYTGTDISLLASHLFYQHSIVDWSFAEEPFKLVQAIRNDGVLLTLTFLKEQEFVGWTHSVTDGLFKSTATVTEGISDFNIVDATYFVVERTIGANTVKYVERLADRQFPNGMADAWCVDCGLSYSGTPATTFSGGQHLAGKTCVGLADGIEITPFVMPDDGNFTLPTAASKVTIGLQYICDLQTLPLELGEPTIQGKVKKIASVDVRVADALGLKIGASFDRLVPMKDLQLGNVSSMLTGLPNQLVTDLVTGDARTFLDPTYTVMGQYCIRQDKPYPATVLGVIPNPVIGDDK